MQPSSGDKSRAQGRANCLAGAVSGRATRGLTLLCDCADAAGVVVVLMPILVVVMGTVTVAGDALLVWRRRFLLLRVRWEFWLAGGGARPEAARRPLGEAALGVGGTRTQKEAASLNGRRGRG